MQNREELRQKGHVRSREREKNTIFEKRGGGDEYCFRTNIWTPENSLS
jgi:hypothetical protein